MRVERLSSEPGNDPEIEKLFREGLRDIPDFPIPGIIFKDIAPMLARPRTLSRCASALTSAVRGFGADTLLAVDARGFVIGGAVADRLECGFVMVRKPGKLPGSVVSFDYGKEYGSGRLEITTGVITPGSRCLFVDDLLATGGTARATADCVKALGASIVGYAFLTEISFLNGRARLTDAPVVTLFDCR